MVIYIVGVGRSGTSLLQSIIASHSSVFALPETSFLRRYIYNDNKNISSDRHLSRVPDLKEALINLEDPCSKLSLYTCYKEYLIRQNKDIILEKDPRLIEYAEEIINSSIQCKVVNIFRDPRDVLASKKKAKWSSGRTLLNYLVASRVQLRDAEELANNNSFYSVKYEELIQNTEKVLSEICDFLNIEFEFTMLSHQNSARKLVHKDEVSWKKETFKPINSSNSNKWVEELTNVEALSSFYTVEEFCLKNGYLNENLKYSFMEIVQAKLISKMARLFALCYRLNRSRKLSRLVYER